MHTTFCLFKDFPEGLLYVLPDSEHSWEWHFGLLLGASEKHGKQPTFYCSIEIVAFHTNTRGSKSLQKKIRKTSLTAKIYVPTQRSCIPRQGQGGPQSLQERLLLKVCSFTKSDNEDWKRQHFFQKPQSQLKFTRYTMKQGKHAPVEGTR